MNLLKFVERNRFLAKGKAPGEPSSLRSEAKRWYRLDESIPSNQILELEKQLTSAEVHVLITPFISHTHPRFRELSWFKKLLGYLESFRFLHAFAHYQTIENGTDSH